MVARSVADQSPRDLLDRGHGSWWAAAIHRAGAGLDLRRDGRPLHRRHTKLATASDLQPGCAAGRGLTAASAYRAALCKALGMGKQLTHMKLTVTRLDQGKYETLVTRDDGVSYRLKGVAHHFAIPHDLAHFLVEKALHLRHGFFGNIADGVVFK